jgi:CheY-like chemotaxis protein
MQGTGLAAPDPKTSVNMASLTRMSVLVAERDAARSRDTAELLRELGVQHVAEVSDAQQLEAALRERAFDVLLCAEQLGDEPGLALLETARKAAPATRSVLMCSSHLAGEALPSDADVVELPLSRLRLKDLLEQTASPHGGLWCEVPALSLSDILQMYHQARRSITVLLSGPVAGRVRLESGEIVDAEMGNERGLAALSHLLEAETGLIRTAPASPETERTIDAPFQSVLLEAAQRLDERRRDHSLMHEATGASTDMFQPPVQPRSPEPASFLTPYPPPQQQRRPRAGLIGLLLGAALALAAAFSVGRGQTPRAPASAPQGALSPSELEQSAQALRPVPGSSPLSSPEPPREASNATVSTADSPAAKPTARFTLHIASKPSRATVLEAGKVLGRTPLDVSISASSVASGPRRFVLRYSGYLPSRIVQTASASDVDAMVVLQPRSTPAAEKPDGGRADSEAAAAAGRATGSRGRRKEPGVRTRR